MAFQVLVLPNQQVIPPETFRQKCFAVLEGVCGFNHHPEAIMIYHNMLVMNSGNPEAEQECLRTLAMDVRKDNAYGKALLRVCGG